MSVMLLDAENTGGIPVTVGGADGALVERPGQLQYGDMLLGGGTPARWRELVGWRDTPESQQSDSPRPQAHGTYAGDVWGDALTVTFTYLLRGTAEDKAAAVDAIEKYAPMDGVERALVVDDGTGPWLRMARVIGRQVPQDYRYRTGPVLCSIQFLCADPRRYALTEKSGTVRLPTSSGGLEYPLEYGGAPVLVATNLEPNASYETVESWIGAGGSDNPVRSTDHAADGSWSVKCTRGAGTGAGIAQRSAFSGLLPGAGTYTVTIPMWVSSVITGSAGLRVSGSGTTLVNVYTPARDTWQDVTVTFSWDGVGTLFLQAVDESITPGATFYLDKAIITAGTEVVPFFSGDTPNDGTYRYDWTGTPGDSTSTKTLIAVGGLDYGQSASGSATANNAGSTDTPVVVTFHGPLEDPALVTATWRLGFNITLTDGESLTVDTYLGTALLNGTADRLYTLTTASTPLELCQLKPGATNLSLIAPSGSGRAEVAYRDARM